MMAGVHSVVDIDLVPVFGPPSVESLAAAVSNLETELCHVLIRHL